MVLVNRATNEVTVKLVYYGPGLCGKTTNLEKVYSNPKLENKGKMISMATETDRTLFFDFMPMELGTIAGQKIRVQLYTVPGQVFYDATRKLVLRGADGVVFVADSQTSMQESNIQSLENLRTNLRLNHLDPDRIALVFQYNKRDLPNISSVEEMTAYLHPGDHPVVEAAAINAVGVSATLRAAVGQILENLKKRVDYGLREVSEPSGDAPEAAEPPELASAEPEPVSMAAAPAEPSADDEEPFAAPSFTDDINPFAADASPFGDAAVEVAAVGAVVEASPEPSPFAGEVVAVDGSNDEAADLQAMHLRAQELIRTLEDALEIARAQEEQLARRLHG